MGKAVDAMMAFNQGADGIAMARYLHDEDRAMPMRLWALRQAMKQAGIPVREAA